jgi:hypothetical protein
LYILKSLIGIVIVLLIAGLVVVAILARSPKFNPDYFFPEYQEKYSSPEAAFNGLWDAQLAGDKELYAAVLGRDFLGTELGLTASTLDERPAIEKVTSRENSAYVQADGWRGSFEKIGGRWVFQNKEIGYYCRSIFRLFGVELARFN